MPDKRISSHAFTLIELLIVVAIIGILAAIAVPNFLNAMQRAKISREYSDMKALSTAIQSFRIDRNVLLVDIWDDDQEWGQNRIKNIFNNAGFRSDGSRSFVDVFAPLTTPVSYIATIPQDPFTDIHRQREAFSSVSSGYTPSTAYGYGDNDPEYAGSDHGLLAFTPVNAPLFGVTPLAEGDYLLVGMGPDGEFAAFDLQSADVRYGVIFDASNGLNSIGDVLMRGSGGLQ